MASAAAILVTFFNRVLTNDHISQRGKAMSWENFIEKNVFNKLVKPGYTPTILQGGRRCNYTGACPRAAPRDGFMTIAYGMPGYGLKNTVCRSARKIPQWRRHEAAVNGVQMARIRTVKPEFWTDEKVVECSIAGRLLFIGLFNFANDRGCLERSPKRIKMQVFPADVVDCEPLIQELIAHGLLSEYSVNGVEYLAIKGFAKHQKINRPSASNIPNPPEFTESEVVSGGEFTEDSLSDQGGLTDDSLNTHGALTEESVSHHGGLTDGRDTEGKGSKTTLFKNEYEKKSLSKGKPKSADFPDLIEPVFYDGIPEPIGAFTMYAAWHPMPDFRQRAAVWGIILPVGDYLSTELAEFIAWFQSGGKVFYQTQWEQKFARHIQRTRAKVTQIPEGISNGKQAEPAPSKAVQAVRAARTQWECEQRGTGVAPVGENGGGVL